MCGDRRTPRGLSAPQTSSHTAGGTSRSVAPNHGQRAIKKGNIFKRRRHYGRRIPQDHPSRQPRSRPTSDAITNTTSNIHQINLINPTSHYKTKRPANNQRTPRKAVKLGVQRVAINSPHNVQKKGKETQTQFKG